MFLAPFPRALTAPCDVPLLAKTQRPRLHGDESLSPPSADVSDAPGLCARLEAVGLHMSASVLLLEADTAAEPIAAAQAVPAVQANKARQ